MHWVLKTPAQRSPVDVALRAENWYKQTLAFCASSGTLRKLSRENLLLPGAVLLTYELLLAVPAWS